MDEDQPHAPTTTDPAQARVHQLTREVEQLRARQRVLAEQVSASAQEAALRFRNILAIVRSMFCRTAATSATTEALSQHFVARFDAVARLGRDVVCGRQTDLEDVIRDELLTFHEGDEPKTVITGPSVILGPGQLPLIGLAIHELAMNAVKFGAFAHEGATLAVRWEVDEPGGKTLHLTWIESGVPVIASAPLHRGFGREFIEQALPYQLSAPTKFELRPGGVRCTIEVPLIEGSALRGE